MESNTLLPIDDLYWNELEGKYTAISPSEIDVLLATLFRDTGVEHDENDDPCEEDLDIALRVLDWATHVRTGNLLLQGVLSGRLDIAIRDGEDTPIFSVREINEHSRDDRASK